MRRNDDTYWKGRLTPEQYRITRLRGTEPAYSGEYCATHELGVYRCVCCDAPLFGSNAKFDSGTGWPSFSAPIDEQAVEQRADQSFLMRRTEVLCHACGAHLGHLFTDGPAPTGRRYCINSVALRLEPPAGSQPASARPPERRQVERRRVHHP